MNQELKSRMQETVLNHGHIMIGYTDIEELLKYIDNLENSKVVLNKRISDLYRILEVKDNIINEQIRTSNRKKADITFDRLLSIAKKMHTWIFIHTGDEQAAYDELELTDEENALLGYGGRYTVRTEDVQGENQDEI